MNRKFKNIFAVALSLFMGITIFPSHLPASEITIVGVVNNSNQIVADEVIFEIDDTPEGEHLITKYIGKKVKVTGMLNIEGDMRIISVKEFEVIKN